MSIKDYENVTEEEFRAHPAGQAFFAKCEKEGVDLTGWMYGECSIDEKPFNYHRDKPDFKNCPVYYCHPTDEDVACSAEMDDSTGNWAVSDFGVYRD